MRQTRKPPQASESALVKRCQAFAAGAGWVAGAIGLAGLVGWGLGSAFLLQLLPGAPRISLAAAVLLTVTGVSLGLLRLEAAPRWRHAAGHALAWVTVLLSGAMLLKSGFGLELGLQRLGLERGWHLLAYPQTSASFLFLGIALLALDGPPIRRVVLAEVFALLAFLIPYVALLGYGFGFILYDPAIGMAVHAAFGLLLISFGVLCSRPHRGVMAAFTRASPGGIILRRFLPAIMLGPPLLGLLRLEAVRFGLLSEPIGTAFLVLAMTAVTMALSVWNAVSVDRLDAERRRSEEYLRQFQILVSSVTDYAIFLLDPKGRVRSWNTSAERLKGLRESEILGRSFSRFFSSQELKERKPHRLLREAASTGRAYDEAWHQRPDGTARWEEMALTALRDDSGRLVGFAVIIRDLTERKKAYEEVARRTAELSKARELNALKDHFLSTISHEMKTPLSLITGFAELLEDSGQQKPLVAGMQEGIRRLTEHIDNMLDYSALLSGALPLYATDVNLREVAEHARLIAAERAGEARRPVELEVDPATPPVLGDSRRITQMIAELLENASKFSPPEARMGVRIGPVDSSVRIDVWDTGPGIPEQDFPRIWEAFSQLEVEDALRKGGLGLGLTIVKKLAELHGGRVAVVSQLGRGTTFSILLPVAGHPGMRPAKAPDSGTSEKG